MTRIFGGMFVAVIMALSFRFMVVIVTMAMSRMFRGMLVAVIMLLFSRFVAMIVTVRVSMFVREPPFGSRLLWVFGTLFIVHMILFVAIIMTVLVGVIVCHCNELGMLINVYPQFQTESPV
mmetsp:Transcript_46507/g.140912  ORF Transcript_46507/g.140912 Transcript_46507/m.140912 type:complete len:121 (+) Transcript_46507:632-994(+)